MNITINIYIILVFTITIIIGILLGFLIAIITSSNKSAFFISGWILYFCTILIIAIILSGFLANHQKYEYQKIDNQTKNETNVTIINEYKNK